jgi:hypothetical protein
MRVGCNTGLMHPHHHLLLVEHRLRTHLYLLSTDQAREVLKIKVKAKLKVKVKAHPHRLS